MGRQFKVFLIAVVSITFFAGCSTREVKTTAEKTGKLQKEAIRIDKKLSEKEEQRNIIKAKIIAILEREKPRITALDVVGAIKMQKEIYSMGDEVVPVLLEILSESNDGRDGYLMQGFFISKGPHSFRGDPRITPGLLKILQGKNHNGRIWAADTLGRLKAKEALDILIEALDDEDEGVRDSAIRALANIGDKKAEAPLLKIVQDGRGLGIAALGEISSDDTLISTLLPLYEKSRNPHMVTRTDRGLKRQVDRNMHIRLSIIDVLAKIRRTEVVDFFIKELELEKDGYVKDAIYKVLIEYLNDEDEVLKSKVSNALKSLKRVGKND